MTLLSTGLALAYKIIKGMHQSPALQYMVAVFSTGQRRTAWRGGGEARKGLALVTSQCHMQIKPTSPQASNLRQPIGAEINLLSFNPLVEKISNKERYGNLKEKNRQSHAIDESRVVRFAGPAMACLLASTLTSLQSLFLYTWSNRNASIKKKKKRLRPNFWGVWRSGL